MISSLSVVVPVFNSASTLQHFHNRLITFLSKQNYSSEVIYVDDCSTDGSSEVVNKLHSTKEIRVFCYRLTANHGQHRAIAFGMGKANYELVVTLDDDLQFDPERIEDLVGCYISSGCDVVCAFPKNRNMFSLITTKSLLVLMGSYSKLPNGGSSFRLLRSSVAKFISDRARDPFLFIDAAIFQLTDKIASIPILKNSDGNGMSRYSISSKVIMVLLIFVNYLPFFRHFILNFILISIPFLLVAFCFKLEQFFYLAFPVSLLLTIGMRKLMSRTTL